MNGTYKGFLCFMDGELYVGLQEGQPHVELSLPAIGVMHTPTKNVAFREDGLSFTMSVNGLDGHVDLKLENGRLTGEMVIREVDRRFSVDVEKISGDYAFCEEYYEIAEENRAILQNSGTYTAGPAAVQHTYELGNSAVLQMAADMGISVENRHDFATIFELMLQTERAVHQDGVNYCHSKEHGALAQLKHAQAQNNYTNCRGISIIFAGILRAYGFRTSYVECWPADPDSNEIHVVCEVYAPDLKKYVVLDISNRMVFFKDGVPLSLLELRNVIAAGEEHSLTTNGEIRNSMGECLAYLSKNLVVFCKQLDNNETDEIQQGNSICLVPEEQRENFSKWKKIQLTSNPRDFYPQVEK